MTDPNNLQLIEQDVAAWNRWREENPDVTPDLSRAYLFEADLSGANLSGVTLHRACLIGTNLKGANLQGADLSGAYVSKANLCNANLHKADLNETNFSESNLTGADLSQTQANATNFAAAEFTGVCLDKCQISHTTRFDDIRCRYVYLGRDQRNRYPDEGEFQPEELAQFIHRLREAGALDQGYAVPLNQAYAVPLVPVSPTVRAAIASDSSPPAAQSGTAATLNTVPIQPIAAPPSAQQTAQMSRLPTSSGFALVRRNLFVGGGSVVLALVALALLLNAKLQPPIRAPQPAPSAQSVPSTQSSPTASFPILPCNELSPPALPDRAPDYEYKDGTRFYGRFVDGIPVDGRGIMVFPTGQRYDGDYRQGKRNGCGTMTFNHDRRYTGQFQDDQFHGLGVWTLENGDRYIGEFRNNKCDGVGTFILKDGSFQSGNWQNGDLIDGTVSCNSDPLDMPQAPE